MIGTAVNFGDYISLTLDADTFVTAAERDYIGSFGIRFGPGVVVRGLGVLIVQIADSKPRRPGWMKH